MKPTHAIAPTSTIMKADTLTLTESERNLIQSALNSRIESLEESMLAAPSNGLVERVLLQRITTATDLMARLDKLSF